MRFFIGLLALIFLGSCASKNPVFIKRRYNHGYYTNFGSHKYVRAETAPGLELKKKVEHKTELVIAGTSAAAKTALDPNKIPLVSLFKKKTPATLVEKGGAPVLAHKAPRSAARSFVPKKIASIKKPAQDLGFVPILEGPGVAIVLFIVFTLIYTLCILAKAPDMNLGVALGLAMLGALISICTGVVFLC